jgi:4-hydroxy-tetrahydrodipicolinate synthase
LVADQRDQPRALSLYKRILPIVRWVGGQRYVSATKAGLAFMGRAVGPPRPPRLPLPTADAASLRRDLEALKLTSRG